MWCARTLHLHEPLHALQLCARARADRRPPVPLSKPSGPRAWRVARGGLLQEKLDMEKHIDFA